MAAIDLHSFRLSNFRYRYGILYAHLKLGRILS